MKKMVIWLIIVLFAGCGSPEPELPVPVDFYISSSCAGNERAIRDGAESWNRASCVDVFRYRGISNDGIFNTEDLQDGKLTIYCVGDGEKGDAKKYLFSSDQIGLQPGVKGDVLLWDKKIKEFVRRINLDKPLSAVESAFNDYMREVVAHELGHYLGLPHQAIEDQYSVMQESVIHKFLSFSPTRLDLDGSEKQRGLCDIIICPPPEQCPTRPTL